MSRKVIKIILAGLFCVLGIFVLLPAAVILWTIFFPVCNIHGQETSLSPEGIWHLTLFTDGCTEFSIVGDDIDWHSKVTISKTTGRPKASYFVFESNSPYNVTFTWPKRNELHIEVSSAANITRSERNVPGLSISYGVPQRVLRDVAMQLNNDDRQIALIREKAASGSPLADGKTDAKIDENDRKRLDQFRAWSQRYTHPPHS